MSIRYNGSNKVISDKKYIRFNGHTKYKEAEVPTDYLCFTAAQDNSSVGYSITGTVDTSGIQYSRNMGRTWTNWNGTAISLNSGQKMYVRNTNNTLSTDTSNYFNFTMTGLISASGNIMSMINFSELTVYCYYSMFNSCSSLTTAPQLPATTLADNCYQYMFSNCSSLTTPPQLPATTLAIGCYYRMFSKCSSLTTAPQLPATTLADNCYYYMFNNCSSLIVNDTQTSSSPYTWTIPQTGSFNNSMTQSNMFNGTGGTRSSNDLQATSGQSKTYYTQNQPI